MSVKNRQNVCGAAKYSNLPGNLKEKVIKRCVDIDAITQQLHEVGTIMNEITLK